MCLCQFIFAQLFEDKLLTGADSNCHARTSENPSTLVLKQLIREKL